MLPDIINKMVEAGVSISRIRSFLLCEEHKLMDQGDLQDIGVKLSGVSCAYESKKPRIEDRDQNRLAHELLEKNWEIALLKSQLEDVTTRIKELTIHVDHRENVAAQESQINPTGSLLCLKQINLDIKCGELVALVGGVGSGKSSLLNAILGEVRELGGKTEVYGSLAYFAQSPFVLNATLKANILFSHIDEPIDEDKYQRALDCCALRPDLGTFCKRKCHYVTSA